MLEGAALVVGDKVGTAVPFLTLVAFCSKELHDDGAAEEFEMGPHDGMLVGDALIALEEGLHDDDDGCCAGIGLMLGGGRVLLTSSAPSGGRVAFCDVKVGLYDGQNDDRNDDGPAL